MENIVKGIMKMSRAERTAIAHGLLMELEKAGDVTCWQFWERETVKELMEENLERVVDGLELTKTMNALNRHWNGISESDFHAFRGTINDTLKKVKIERKKK